MNITMVSGSDTEGKNDKGSEMKERGGNNKMNKGRMDKIVFAGLLLQQYFVFVG